MVLAAAGTCVLSRYMATVCLHQKGRFKDVMVVATNRHLSMLDAEVIERRHGCLSLGGVLSVDESHGWPCPTFRMAQVVAYQERPNKLFYWPYGDGAILSFSMPLRCKRWACPHHTDT